MKLSRNGLELGQTSLRVLPNSRRFLFIYIYIYIYNAFEHGARRSSKSGAQRAECGSKSDALPRERPPAARPCASRAGRAARPERCWSARRQPAAQPLCHRRVWIWETDGVIGAMVGLEEVEGCKGAQRATRETQRACARHR